MSRRNLMFVVVAVLVVVCVLFPTAHIRHLEELVETLDCAGVLEEGESLHELWTDMEGETRIEVNVTCSKDVRIFLVGINGSDTTDIYSLTKEVHSAELAREFASYNVTVWNPTEMGLGGGSATISGSVKAYHVYEIVEWLPWWMS